MTYIDNHVLHLCRKIKEVGIKNTLTGIVRRKKLGQICQEYDLDPWHKSPYELRRYAQIAAESVNELEGKCVVEVGCGLGEILRHINAPKKYGYDLDSRVIEAVKVITSKEKNIQYFAGGLQDVNVSDANVLLTIGWMHGMQEKALKELYGEFLNKNKVKNVVVDVKIIENQKKDFTKILPLEYHCVSRKKCVAEESEIWIETYERGEI